MTDAIFYTSIKPKFEESWSKRKRGKNQFILAKFKKKYYKSIRRFLRKSSVDVFGL